MKRRHEARFERRPATPHSVACRWTRRECASLHSDFDTRTKITLRPYRPPPSSLPLLPSPCPQVSLTVSHVRARCFFIFGRVGLFLSSYASPISLRLSPPFPPLSLFISCTSLTLSLSRTYLHSPVFSRYVDRRCRCFARTRSFLPVSFAVIHY